MNNTQNRWAAAVTIVFALVLLSPRALVAGEGATAFYQWQEGQLPDAGNLLRSESLEPELVLAQAASGKRILYASEGFAGVVVPVSGAVFIPRGEAPKGGWPVLAWSHGTVGVADVCAPSYAGRSERDVTYLNEWLSAGYAVVATDYEGLGTAGTHPYLHCRSEAFGNIDAVSAAHQLGLPLAKQWLVTGQSQGGQGALCTGAYVSERESALDFLGTVATAPGVNFMSRFAYGEASDPNPFVGLSLLLGRGFETFEPSFDRRAAFTDAALAMMPATDTQCVQALMGMGAQAGLTSGESMKVVPFSETPGVAAAAKQLEIPLTGWAHPVYIAQGTKDELVRYQDVYDFGVALCDRDVDVTLQVFEGADHSGPMNRGVKDFIGWSKGRFTGASPENNCAEIRALAKAAR